MRRRILCALTVVVVGAAIAGFILRDRLLAQYYVFRLTQAGEADAEQWIGDAPSWGRDVEPALLAEMNRDDAARCGRAGAALVAMHCDSISDLGAVFAARYEQVSPAGQEWLLQQAANWDGDGSRQLIASALRSSLPSLRLRAIAVAVKLGGSLEFLAPLIKDSDSEVRQATIRALGLQREWLSDDELLPLLHDPERDVQRLARTALLARGLTDNHVHFGKLLTDSNPTSRLELVGLLRDDAELDLSAWYGRLSRDPAPAVRAAAVRSIADLRIFQLGSRIEEMAGSDPDQSVRSIAQFHLVRFKSPEN
jgi:hypothetical protein